MASSHQHSKRRFAPLGQPGSDGAPALRGIVFDMDGTLCEPQNHMFGEMRAALDIDKGTDILDHIYSLSPEEQEAAHGKIQAIERKAMAEQVPQAGLVTLMEFLDKHGVKKAICTRNFDTPVTHLLTTHLPSHISAFHPIVTRDFRPPKPSPAGILHIAKAWGVASEQAQSPSGKKPLPLIMVGDSIDDMIAGHEAGALTVLVKSKGKEELETIEQTDVVVERLDELVGLLEGGIEGR